MFKGSKKSQQNQHFYLKKLHTQSFSSPSLKDQFNKLTDKLEHQIQAVKKHMRVKNLKMFRAKEKLKIIENEQQNMRETLRVNIENKLKQSQSKLETMMMTKNTKSSSKEKLRQTTLSRIKSMEKTLAQESFRKSQVLSKDSQSFLVERKNSESRQRISSYAPIPIRTRYADYDDDERTHESLVLLQSRKRILPHVLKVTDKEIKHRQLRRNRLEQTKDIKNLHEYIEKLNSIDVKRQNRSDRLTQTVKLIEKERKKEEQKYLSRKKAQSLGQRDKSTTNYLSATKEAIKNKYSFSELYAKKLQQKLQKKAFFEGESFMQGDLIMRKEREIKQKKRQNKLLNQTIKQVQRKVNFKFMERFRQ